MKYPLLFVLMTLMLFSSCKKDKINIPTCVDCSFTCLEVTEIDVVTNTCIDNWTCEFKVWPQSKVDVDEGMGFTNGDKNVFFMRHQTEGDLAIADDEFSETLVFELAESQNSFSVEGNEFENGLKVHFQRACYCLETEYKMVDIGCIQGEKQPDGHWWIQGKVTIPFTGFEREVKFDAQFVL